MCEPGYFSSIPPKAYQRCAKEDQAAMAAVLAAYNSMKGDPYVTSSEKHYKGQQLTLIHSASLSRDEWRKQRSKAKIAVNFLIPDAREKNTTFLLVIADMQREIELSEEGRLVSDLDSLERIELYMRRLLCTCEEELRERLFELENLQ